MPEPKRPLKVFLCHASADKPKVRELYRYLKKRGIQPWLDAEDLLPGQNWQVEIPKAIEESDAILICLSKTSINKEGFVQKEIRFALDKALELPEGRIFIIPARLDECEVPRSLSNYQWVDLFDDAGKEKLMKSLRMRARELQRSIMQTLQPDNKDINSLQQPKQLSENINPTIVHKQNEESPQNNTYNPSNQSQHRSSLPGLTSASSSNDFKPMNLHSNSVVKISPIALKEGNSSIAQPINQVEQKKDVKPPNQTNIKNSKDKIDHSKTQHKLKTEYIVAIIGASATLLAALIGILPQFIKTAPTPTATVTMIVVHTPTLQPSLTPTKHITTTSTFTPTITLTSTQTQFFVLLIIYNKQTQAMGIYLDGNFIGMIKPHQSLSKYVPFGIHKIYYCFPQNQCKQFDPGGWNIDVNTNPYRTDV